MLIVGMRCIMAFAICVFRVRMTSSVGIRMTTAVKQLIGPMAFAGTKENKSERGGKDSGFTENGSHLRHTRHRS